MRKPIPLIEQLFELYVQRGCPPDVLSVKYGSRDDGILRVDDKTFICFEWFSGKSRMFGYTSKAYEAIWERFNTYWVSEGK